MAHWTGLNSHDYAMGPISLPAFSGLTAAEFGWAIALAVVVALATFVITELARWSAALVAKQPWVLLPVAALVVGGLAIAFCGDNRTIRRRGLVFRPASVRFAD